MRAVKVRQRDGYGAAGGRGEKIGHTPTRERDMERERQRERQRECVGERVMVRE